MRTGRHADRARAVAGRWSRVPGLVVSGLLTLLLSLVAMPAQAASCRTDEVTTTAVLAPGETTTTRRTVPLPEGEVVMTAAKAKALGLQPLARIVSYATSGLDPKVMGLGPISATRKTLERAGWKVEDVDLFELNEAFAAQACAVNQELGIDAKKVNVNGGAIAIGHPIGASGCRILVTLLHEMQRSGAKKGVAGLCIGGGMGVAMALERV